MSHLIVHHAQGILQITVPNDSILEDRVRRLDRNFRRAGGSWFGNGVGDEDLPSRLVWVSASAHVEVVFDSGVPFSLGDICDDVDINGMVAKSMREVLPPGSTD
jgi:hypothetical protein